MNWISYMFCFLMVGCLAVYIFTKTEYIQLAWAAIGTGLAFYVSHPNAGVGQPAAGIIETLGVVVFAWCFGTTVKQYVLKRKKQRDCVDSTADAEEKPLTIAELQQMEGNIVFITPLNDWAKVMRYGLIYFGTEKNSLWQDIVDDYGEKWLAYRHTKGV